MAVIRAKEAPPIEPRWLQVYDTFELLIGWLPPKRRDDIRRQAYLKRGTVNQHGDETYARLFCREVIRDWRGLTLNILTGVLKVFPADDNLIELQAEERELGELRYNQDSAVAVYRNAIQEKFSRKVDEFLSDWDEENDAVERERKNDSGASSATSATQPTLQAVSSAKS